MKILIIKLSSIGDIIHTFPAIIDAKNNIEDLTVDWLIDQNFENIPNLLNNNLLNKNNKIINQIIPISLRTIKKNKNLINLKQLLLDLLNLRTTTYDLIIDAQGLLKSLILAKFIKSKCILGFNWHSAREPLASLFYNKKFNINKQLHAVTRIRILFSLALNYTIDLSQNLNQNINFGLDKQNFSKLPELISESINKNTNQYIVFLHGTTWETKEWDITYWQQLRDLILAHKNNFNIVLTCSNNNLREQELVKNLITDRVIILQQLNIHQISCMLAHATAAIAVDTGFAHLAGALGVPVVCIYGATCSIKSQVIGKNCVNLQSTYHCSPCLSKICLEYKHKKSLTKQPCLKEITPEIIFDKLQFMI